jgi:hypothetical protein
MKTVRRMALLVCVLILAGCDVSDFIEAASQHEPFHMTFPASPGVRLTVETQNGQIEISGWDKNTVDVDGEKLASSEDLLHAIRIETDTSSPGEIRLRTAVPAGIDRIVGVRYAIHVPAKAVLERIVTSNSSIRVDNVQGDVNLRTSNGTITDTATAGRLDSTTSNGAIEVNDHRGDVEAHSSNGHIWVDASGGMLRASTSNSGIEARLHDPRADEPVKLDSSNGHILLSLDGEKLPSVKAVTSNSSIELWLPTGASAQIHASTYNSRISSDFEMTFRPGSTPSKHRLDAQLGSGGPLITLATSNGAIRIRKEVAPWQRKTRHEAIRK